MTNAEASRQWRERNPEKYKAAKEQLKEKLRNEDEETKATRAAYHREWMKNNADQQREYRRNKAEKLRDYNLQYNFGITLEEYEALYVQQFGLCAICGFPPKPGKALDVDHDHETGKVRGLLCRQCNHGLGLFRDNANNLRKAARYLDGASESKTANTI